MSQYSTPNWEAFYGTAGASFPDNTSGLITELIMRTFGQDLSDSFWNRVSGLQGLTTATGTDTYAITGGISAYASGFTVFVKFTNANTGSSTLNVNSLGAKTIKKQGNTNLASGDISVNQILLLQYDGTNFQIIGGSGSGATLTDALVFKGVIDCSANPNYPAADAGDVYKVSVAGKIGGASGPNVEAGDLLTCIVDASSSGNHATVGANWVISQTNIDGAVTGPASSTDGGLALYNGTTGKVIKSDGLSPANDDVLQRKSGTWVNRTLAQYRADLTSAANWLALSNLPQVSTKTLLGRISPGTGDVEVLSQSDLQDLVFDFSNDVIIFTHFMASAIEGGIGAVNSGAGSAISVNITSDPGGRPGISTKQTGTTATGHAYNITNALGILLGYGVFTLEMVVRVQTLSDGTDTFFAYWGLGDNYSSNPQDGAYFRYTHSENSGQLRCVTVNNNSETITDLDGTYAIAAGTWYNLEIEVDATAANVYFYVNGTLVATHTTNIPKTTGRNVGYIDGLRKTAGSTSRTTETDYTVLRYKLT